MEGKIGMSPTYRHLSLDNRQDLLGREQVGKRNRTLEKD